MKKILMCVSMLFWFCGAEAQTKKSPAKKTSTKSSVAKKPAKKKEASQTTTTFTLTDTAGHSAKEAPATFNNQLFIADPTAKALDARAEGMPIRISGSGIVGMPRGSYGFKNGQFRLYPSGATTSGGITGNGSVGTGSFTGSIGTHSSVMGVNGKSPYAGSNMWGLNGAVPPGNKSDSSVRRIEVKDK